MAAPKSQLGPYASYSGGRGFRVTPEMTFGEILGRRGGGGAGFWKGRPEIGGSIDAGFDWRNLRSLEVARGPGGFGPLATKAGQTLTKATSRAGRAVSSAANKRFGATGGFNRADVTSSMLARRFDRLGPDATPEETGDVGEKMMALQRGPRAYGALNPAKRIAMAELGPASRIAHGERAPREFHVSSEGETAEGRGSYSNVIGSAGSGITINQSPSSGQLSWGFPETGYQGAVTDMPGQMKRRR